MEEKSKKRKKTDWLGTVGLSLILMAAVLLIWFFLQGQTTVEGDWPGDVKDTSLSCSVDGMLYPIFEYDEAVSKKIETKLIFDNDELRTVSLTATMKYNNSDKVYASVSHNEAAMNRSFGASGLGANALSAVYSENSDSMVMTLYARASEYNEVIGKYFLSNGIGKNASLETFKTKYETQGFSCTKSE